MLAASVLALVPGHGELLLLLVIGLLIFGRRLPEVGRAVGKTLMQFRRGFQDFKSQLDDDPDVKDARATVHEIRRAAEIPRSLVDPRRLLEEAPDPSGTRTDSTPQAGTTPDAADRPNG